MAALALPALPARYRPASVWALYAVGLLPGLYAFYLGIFGGLGADPVRAFEHLLGLWALKFLCLGLAVTPLRDLFGINLIGYRRALGLLAFYYVLAHFAVYLTLDRGMILSSIAGDLLKRPYIMLGMAGLLMLIPLALTSNQWSIRRLGQRWNRLHKLTYPILLVAVLHYALSLKVIDPEAAFYIVVTILLLGYRLVRPKIMERRRAKRMAIAK
jgi:sulfoxide reductase heme-binding subunit YedZ